MIIKWFAKNYTYIMLKMRKDKAKEGQKLAKNTQILKCNTSFIYFFFLSSSKHLISQYYRYVLLIWEYDFIRQFGDFCHIN